jgi:multiple sugar transport system ATP-binding protein
MAEIVLDKVSKRYPDGSVAVREIDVTIADGEFVILVGPSGCGKSTTLNMIAGLEDISSGELRIAGRRVNEKAPKDRDIAMVFQSYALYPHMTVRENIAFPLRLAKLPKDQIVAKVADAARILDLGELLDRRPANLSGGQRQRVAMGRAIVRQPKAFLMDEPLSNLDAKLRVQMRAEISRLQKRLGTTTVYVTHDQTEAMTLGDRVVVLRGGVVQQIGAPQELYDRPANLFVAGFIGSPSMNFVPGELTPDGVKTALGTIVLPEDRGEAAQRHPAAQREVIVGVRPESFEDAELVDSFQRITGLRVDVEVDLVESMGSDKYAYFALDEPVRSTELQELAAETGGPAVADNQFVARLSNQSRAARGHTLQLWFDPGKTLIFDQATGVNLLVPAPVF